MCSALLKAASNTNPMDAVKAILENTAFIAGWMPNPQAAQLRYVKECAKRSDLSSRQD
jgi:hypothetical protein